MIRAFDRFYSKHPRISAALMIVACAVCFYAAGCADRDNDAAIRLQMMATTSRSAT